MQNNKPNNNSEFRIPNSELKECVDAIEKRLSEFFVTKNEGYSELLESIRYSLLDGGKRIRGILCIKFCEAAGGKAADALDAACAIEMLHSYSLIHDDLPCMDDSDMRRGKPSNHVKYGEFTATLAGDALQAAAFEILLGSDLPSSIVVELGQILADAAGTRGICGGQFLDLSSETKPLATNELTEIHTLKTAALISAASCIGVVAAGGTSAQLKAAKEYAHSVGLAFQVRDDMLDITAKPEELGKPVGSDSTNCKTTFATLFSLCACKNIIHKETENAIAAISDVFDDTEFLVGLARMLATREH
jgi:geranylgeranyl diphosphate synthase type II